jgi:hypothetical protein
MANRCKLGSFGEAWIAETMRTGDGMDTYMPVFLSIMNALWLSMKTHDGHEVDHREFFDDPRQFLISHLRIDGFVYEDGRLWAPQDSFGWWQEILFEGHQIESLLQWLCHENQENALDFCWRGDTLLPQIQFQFQ